MKKVREGLQRSPQHYTFQHSTAATGEGIENRSYHHIEYRRRPWEEEEAL
jgi:hypothetical protein